LLCYLIIVTAIELFRIKNNQGVLPGLARAIVNSKKSFSVISIRS